MPAPVHTPGKLGGLTASPGLFRASCFPSLSEKGRGNEKSPQCSRTFHRAGTWQSCKRQLSRHLPEPRPMQCSQHRQLVPRKWAAGPRLGP